MGIGKTERRIGNYHIIALVDRIQGENIYRVECVCGSVGRASRASMKAHQSCGCTSIVKRHRLGLKINDYTFTKFLGDCPSGKYHLYEIECDTCGETSVVRNTFARDRCPKCPRIVEIDGELVNLKQEAAKAGLTYQGFLARLKVKTIQEARLSPKSNRGGRRGIHGQFAFRGVTDYAVGHLRRLGLMHRKPAVYSWIRSGSTPLEAVERVLFEERGEARGLDILERLFPAPVPA